MMHAPPDSDLRLRLTEIFYSLQGESVHVGLPTVFVRLTGCPLRCTYCDTSYAFKGGRYWTLPALLDKIATYNCPYICITGGEPLAQPACLPLLQRLEQHYQVSLETSGALSIQSVPSGVMIVMDIKTPHSQEADKNRWENLAYLKPTDQVKFVLGNRADYEWAKQQLHLHALPQKAGILFSPSFHELNATTLAEWILQDRLPVRMQIQLHKHLWHDEPGR